MYKVQGTTREKADEKTVAHRKGDNCMNVSMEMLLRKQDDSDDPILDAMKNARDDYCSSVFGWEEVYSTDSDVDMNNVLVDGAKAPDELIKTAERWNSVIDNALENAMQKVLRIYQKEPGTFLDALAKACNLPPDNPNHVLCYSLRKCLESYDDVIAYGGDFGIISEEYGDLHVRMRDEELEEIRKHPENFFIAVISVYGE